MAISSYRFHPWQSTLQLLIDLRFGYAVVSSGLILLGFFWNNLAGFTFQYVILIVGIFCANVFMFVVNDFYDASHDVHDPGKRVRNVFCSDDSAPLGKTVLYTSLIGSLFMGAFVSLPIFMIIVLFDVLAFSYSAPPIKLRNRHYWDWVFVFLWKGLIIAASYIYFFGTNMSSVTPFMFGTLVIILLFSLIHQMDNQLRDFTVDRLTNSNHSVQRLGYETSTLLKGALLVLFFTFSLAFCFSLHLYITMTVIGINISLYWFARPERYGVVLELMNIWIVVLFLEHFIEFFSYRQQVLFSLWIVAMGIIAVIHAKRYNLFGE